MNHRFTADLAAEAIVPDKGILSQVLQKDESVNITLFGMAAGEEISSHRRPRPPSPTFSKVKRQCGSAMHRLTVLMAGFLACADI